MPDGGRMALPNDLKDYEAQRFYLLTEEQAGRVLAWILVLCFLADRLGWLTT